MHAQRSLTVWRFPIAPPIERVVAGPGLIGSSAVVAPVQEIRWLTLAAETEAGGSSVALALGAALALAVVHVVGERLTFLDRIPRSRWLSGAGGVSVAYVFVHVLPELEAGGRAIEGSDLVVLTFFEHHVYLVALAGFVTFYGLEQFTRERAERRGSGERSSDSGAPGSGSSEDEASAEDEGVSGASGMFWIHVGSFAIYNGLIGRLLLHQEGVVTLGTFTVAIGLHFVVNDHGLREIHGDLYDRVGRWLLAGAVLAGAAVGAVTGIGEALFAAVFAFVAGAVVLNTIKEELPEERESRFGAFAAGVVGYTAILITI